MSDPLFQAARRRETSHSVLHARKHSWAMTEGGGSLTLLGMTARLNAGQFVVRLNA
jgi:hypothetical protein